MANLVYMTKTVWQSLLNSIKTKAGYVGTLTASQAKDAVDSIQTGGGDVEITNAANLFSTNARIGQYDDIMSIVSNDTNNFEYFAYQCSANPGLMTFDLSRFTGGTENYNFRQAFNNCTSAGAVILPKTNKTYNLQSAFSGCSNITTLDLSNITALNISQMLTNCNNLTSVNLSGFALSQTATSMSETFSRLTKMTSIDVSDIDTSNITYFGSAFAYCPVLAEIDLSNWTIGANANMSRTFDHCTALSKLTLGANTAAFGYGVTSYSKSPIANCTNLKTLRVKATTPPTIPGAFVLQSSNGVCPLEHIYVPAAAVEDYKAATNWSTYADLISADPEE